MRPSAWKPSQADVSGLLLWGPRTILCVFSDSDSGWRALEWACGLARATRARLVVLHVVKPTATFGIEITALVALAPIREIDEIAYCRVDASVRAVCCEVERVEVSRVVTNGSAEISVMIRNQAADLAVVGLRDTKLRNWVSRATYVALRKSGVPIVTIS